MTEGDWTQLQTEVPPLLQAGNLAAAQVLVRQAVRQGMGRQELDRQELGRQELARQDLARQGLGRQIARDGLSDNLVVTGPPRVGKSALVAEIVARTGAYVVSLDRLRMLYNADDDAPRREASRRAVIEAVLDASPRGIIIEGDDLISENRSAHGQMQPFCLQRLAQWQGRRLARVVIVGCPAITPAEKLAGLQLWRAMGCCWTTHHPLYGDDAEMPGLAYGLVTMSKLLRDLATAAGLPYLPLSHGDFVQEIVSAADALSAPVHA